jgi:hypothetical protein
VRDPRPDEALLGDCAWALGLAQGVVDPRAKCRFWN